MDQFTIFHEGGLVLWSETFVEEVRGSPVDVLIRNVLLEERAAEREFVSGGYRMQWKLDNARGWVFVSVSQNVIPTPYVPYLLDLVRAAFVDQYGTTGAEGRDVKTDGFKALFMTLLRKAEELEKTSRMGKARENVRDDSGRLSLGVEGSKGEVRSAQSTRGQEESGFGEGEDQALDPEEEVRRNRDQWILKQQKKKVDEKSSQRRDLAGSLKQKKGMSETAEATEENLDYSNAGPLGNFGDAEVQRAREIYLDATPNSYTLLDVTDDDDNQLDLDELADRAIQLANVSEDGTSGSKPHRRPANRVIGFFQGLAGRKDLSESDLEQPVGKFKENLIAKNVAAHIADKLCDSVNAQLQGKRMESMTTVSKTVRVAMEDALTRILTPRQGVDMIADIAAKKKLSDDPFVVVFCGVNGVGKSTSLAKICYFLQEHGFKVLLAACDTFRAGAVEQLRTHARCLNVEMYERGYGKDAASVANEAIRHARSRLMDVVLVDTAGRMQDNEPLMRALAKLVAVNKPDRVFFVGEALVGNEAVDQLTKFNQALIDHQPGNNPRTIDGIVLTKFDTIDDKVGAAVSMVYTTGQPIVFVGVGQTYMDLRKVDTTALVAALLK
uniref:SRP54-type proteins GTP-binding domain-containing protein n=1 Tax=Compsopogon caeruleus TaxID=31354 RepID=A0A7S1XAB4_9RHOD